MSSRAAATMARRVRSFWLTRPAPASLFISPSSRPDYHKSMKLSL
jgi:hypothetical protein